MSARQRQRLQQQLKQLDDKPEVSSESSEDEEEPQKTSGFGGLSALSDSSSEEEDVEQNEEELDGIGMNKAEEKSEDSEPGEEEDEEHLLLQAIEEAAASKPKNGTNASIDYSLLFGADKGSLLDVDVFISRRFGKFQSVMGNGAGGQGSKRKAGRAAPARKSIFGCKEEWPKPSSFVAGGLGQKQVDGGYCYEESKEWKKSESLFRIVREFGDINRAILFLLYCNEVHPESLLMLSKTFAVYGRMDRALDTVRRALYTYECASLTSFFSAENLGRTGPPCVLDWKVIQNAPFFTALYRYMYLVGMQGYHTLARDTGRLLLSLSRDDPTMVLLALDHYLVMCNDADSRAIFLAFMGISRLQASDGASLEVEWIGEAGTAGGRGEGGAEGEAAFPLIDLDDPEDGNRHNHNPTVLQLGSWWLSLALLEEQQAQERAEEGLPPDLDTATAVVAEALCRFPYMLQPLLDSMDDLATSSKARFEQAQASPPFITTNTTAPALAEEETALHAKLGHVYAVRNKALWQSRVMLLVAGAEQAVARCAASEEEITPLSSSSPGLMKYASANPEHYAEEIAQFPAEADPLDPQLAEVERLLEQPQLAHQRAILRRMASEQFAFPGGHEELVQTTLIQGLGAPQGGFGVGGAGVNEEVAWAQEEEIAMAMQLDAQARAAQALAAIEEEREMAAAEADRVVDNNGDTSGVGNDQVPPVRDVRREDLQDLAFARPVSEAVSRRFREAPRLDYTAPLMQLLLQSFFCPWFRL